MGFTGEIDDILKRDLIATAHALADVAAPVTLKYFRNRNLETDNKEALGFDPVTIADRKAEAAMRAVLADRRPQDGILGEEFGATTGTSGLTWVLDPIDGTRGYISGSPTWGVLIAVNAGKAPLLGIIDQPYIGERFFGGFGTADVIGPQGRATLKTRACAKLADAVIFTTFPEVGSAADQKGFEAVAKHCKLTRFGMDCYAYAMLAAGMIDLVIEAGLNSYDIQGPYAVVAAAGGIITDWQGKDAYNGGRVLAAGSADIHARALEILSRY